MCRRSIVVSLGLLLAVSAQRTTAGQVERIYWFHGSRDVFVRAGLDGAPVECLIKQDRVGCGVAVDRSAGVLYFTDPEFDRIMRAGLDGADVTPLVCNLAGTPGDIVLDPAGATLYWIDVDGRAIRRAAVDGSGDEAVVTGLGDPRALAVDPATGTIYFTEYDPPRIRRVQPDGSGLETVLDSGFFSTPHGIDVHPGPGLLFFNDGNALRTVGLDGQGLATIVQPTTFGSRVKLDIDAGKVYWAGWQDVRRADLDGGNEEFVVETNVDYECVGFDVAPGADLLFYADIFGGITRATLDGRGAREIIEVRYVSLRDLAIDQARRTMYWIQLGSPDSIWRAGLDGGGVEMLAGDEGARGIAVDAVNERIYWTNPTADVIRRAGLDGSGVETVVSGQANPIPIVVHPAGGAIYWVDYFDDLVRRADLDGGNVTTIATPALGISSTAGIALDAAAGKLYWTDRGNDRVQRANLDGSAIEDFLLVGNPSDLALDEERGHLYFFASGGIGRADVDGGGASETIAASGGSVMTLGPGRSPDLDGDGVVGSADVRALIAAWGPCPCAPGCADLDGDGHVGIADLLAMLANWG